MTKPVAVLGCGPAGLLAAHAVALRGQPIAIFSRAMPSQVGGAQFLHKPIPLITDEDPEAVVTFSVEGDVHEYRNKVYGDPMTDRDAVAVPFVSMENVPAEQPAWSMKGAYERLWDMYGNAVNDTMVGPQWLEDNMDDFSMVVSTVPLPALCAARAGLIHEAHYFTTQTIGITLGQHDHLPDNHVVYDGTKDRAWYRASKLFGESSAEYGRRGVPPGATVISLAKPIGHTCTCWRDMEGVLLMAGRMGKWRKGVLAHQAFEDTWEALGAV